MEGSQCDICDDNSCCLRGRSWERADILELLETVLGEYSKGGATQAIEKAIRRVKARKEA